MKNFNCDNVSVIYTDTIWDDTTFQTMTQTIRSYILDSVNNGERDVDIAFDTQEELDYLEDIVEWLSAEGFGTDIHEDRDEGIVLNVRGWHIMSQLEIETYKLMDSVTNYADDESEQEYYGTTEDGEEVYA